MNKCHQSSDFVLTQLQVLGQLYWPLAEPVTGPIRNHLINNIIHVFKLQSNEKSLFEFMGI